MGKKNFIEINGKKYDAVTGRLLDGKTVQQPVVKSTASPKKNVGAVDGFVKKSQRVKPAVSRTAAKPAPKQVQKSQTLVRSAVSKPKPSTKKPTNVASIQKSQLGTSHRRQQQAKNTPKSQHIQKFETPTARTSVVKKQAHMPVKPAPTHPVKKHQPVPTKTAKTHESVRSRSVAAEKLIESALANAKSHEEQPVRHKTSKRRKIVRKLGISTKTAALSSGVLAFVLLAGFFAVQNVPNLAMRVAASRAGFAATMPSYKPAGFSFQGPVSYSPGKVTVSFRSNTDNRAYDVTEQSSNWNSEALLSNFVIAENKQYQTYLDRGRTLYIYDGSNATWVDNGIWYQIEGESSMTTDQLIRIAASI